MNQPLYSAIVVFIILLTGCGRGREDIPGASENYFQTRFQDESQFIVENVVTDLAEMAIFATTRQVPEGLVVTAEEQPTSEFRKPHYEIVVEGKSGQLLKTKLEVRQAIWSPQLYQGAATKLLGKHSSAANKTAADDLSVLVALTDLQAATIESENQRISSLLETNFNDSTLHEMAAVILGSFALREFSGRFYDVRSPLCRMTAHLALARGLADGGKSGINGVVAETLLFTLMNNQAAALERIKEFEHEPKLQPWVNALRARNTSDYRSLSASPEPTLLERILWYEAMSKSVNSDAGWKELPKEFLGGFADFSRIAFAHNHTVDLGHVLNRSALALEMAEIGKIHSMLVGGKISDSAEFAKFLNQIPEHCFADGSNRVRIIGTGQWSFFLQRHLCHSLHRTFAFLDQKWGVHEEAKKFARQSEENFGALRLFPFVQREHAVTESEYHESVDKGQPVTTAIPHLVPPTAWTHLASAPRFAGHYWPVSHAHMNEWHKHNPPPGTAYDMDSRMYHPSLVNRSDAGDVFEELSALAPFDKDIQDGLIKYKHQSKGSYKQMETVFGPLLAYDADRNWRLASAATNDPALYETSMLRYAKLNAGGYYSLGSYFANLQDTNKAVAYYEKAVELDEDSVRMANNVEWLVNHYFENGEQGKAEELADQAAEVYSSAGLRTKAWLMERQKNYDEALKYYLRIEERYDQKGPLVGFCVRYKDDTGDSRYDHMINERFKTLFPRGRESVDVKSFTSAPEQGLLIAEENDSIREAGLKKGNIIVAADGLRVYDMTQYQYVRALTNGRIRLIVWNGSEYLEKTANPPKRRFGVTFAEYYQPQRK